MIDADWILGAVFADVKDRYGADCRVMGDHYADAAYAVVTVLRELSKRPEDWNRYELADMADEIEGVK